MVVAKLSHQQVIGALRSTGSNDPAVLFAKKEELLAETKRLKLLGIVPIGIGVIMTISLIGAIVGIPMIIFGFLVRKSLKHNLDVSEAAFAEYLRNTAAA